MQSKKPLFVLTIIALMASSCSFVASTSQVSIDSQETSQSAFSSVSSDLSVSSSSSSSSSRSSLTSKEGLTTVTLDSSSASKLSGSYNRTNNGRFSDYTYHIDYEYYMTDKADNVPSGDLAIICQTASDLSDVSPASPLGGFLGNLSALGGIDNFEITYQSPEGSYVKFYDAYASESHSYAYALPSCSSYQKVAITSLGEDYCYFKVFGPLEGELNLQSLQYQYDPSISVNEDDRTYDSKADIRIPMTVSDNNIDDGYVSYAPNAIERNGNTYTVTEKKAYTYYSYSYIASHPELAESVAYTSALDIANYFMLFQVFPANVYANGKESFLNLGSSSEVKSLFGSKARQCSRYSKANGYAKAIDRANDSDYYYEVDIDLTGDYPSNRGTGRIVAFADGVAGYNASSTIFFTDDHYQTFQEYLNYGKFGERFNACSYWCGSSSFERSFITGTTWAKATTLD